MLAKLGQFVVRVADLVEAEGRVLRTQSVRVGAALALTLAAALVFIGGLALVCWAGFMVLDRELGREPAAAICGVALLALAGILLWAATRSSK